MISSTRIGKPWTLKSPKTKTIDGSVERTSSMLDEIESKAEHKDKEGDQ